MSEGLMGRRDFTKILLVLGGGILTKICVPRVLNGLNNEVITPQIPTSYPSATEIPQPSATATQTSTPETPTPEVWNLSLSERIEIMTKPEFFMELQGNNTKKIITLQLDDNEYTRMNRELTHQKNNCGAATLATIKKMFEFLNTGIVPDTTIAYIDNILDGKFFTNQWGSKFKYIENNDLMPVDGFPSAICLLMPQLISKVEYFTPPPFWSSETGSMLLGFIPQTDWAYYMSKAQAVCENGGCAIVVGKKHNFTHIMLATNVKKDGTATFIDSYTGIANRSSLNDIFEQVNGQPAFVALIGITGKLNTSS